MSHREEYSFETGKTLKNPPIIEAVIEFRCNAEVDWVEESVTAVLRERLADYDFLDPRYGYLTGIEFKDGEASSPPIQKNWVGARFRSKDKKYVTSFSNDSFAISRLAPYETWESLKREAIRVWDIHVKVAKSSELNRLILRYINRIGLSSSDPALGDQLCYVPYSPDDTDQAQLV